MIWSMNSTVLTRAELHELLWSEPIKKIATRFGVRPIEIVNAADQAAVPRPPGGHWTQLAFGKASERIPLQPAAEGQPETVTLAYTPRPYSSVAIKMREVKKSERAEPAVIEKPKVVEASEATPRHKFVRQTEKALRGQKPDYTYGWIYPGGDTMSFRVKICKDSIERTLEILDSLVKEADKRGIEITEEKLERSVRLAFKASEELIQFSIVEKVERRVVEPEDGRVSYRKEYSYHPTGKLEFQFEHVYGVTARWKWGDGSTQRIEDFITTILDSVPHIGVEKHRVHLEREAEHRRWEEEANLRKERERQIALEKTRRERLFSQMERWKTGRELLSFAESARTATAHLEKTSELQTWLAWIESLAHEANPFTDKTTPWDEWADHVKKSIDPELKARFYPGHHVWKSG